MKQLMKRFATMALAIIVVVTYVPMGGVALADEASGYSAAQTQLSSGGLAAEGVSDSALGIGAQATTFAIVSYDGQNLTFSDEGKFADQIAKLKNKTVTIALHRDVSCRIVIPEKAKVTLNLNDNMLNRNLNKAKKNGEAIRMETGSTLIVNGGGGNLKRKVGVFNSTDHRDGRIADKTIAGGVICGGWSSNGPGGIYMNANCNLTLNKATIAGCRAEQSWGSDGYGGGIYVCGGNNTITMNDSTITGCFAYNDGGGIYESNKDLFGLYMRNSHIDSNFAGKDGGGLAPSGEKLTINGDGKSTISSNRCVGDGGGIYVWNDIVSISGLVLENNYSSGFGGGIYTLETEYTLSNLALRYNSAKKGGGIFLNKAKKTAITACEVVANTATTAGGGILVNKDTTDFGLAGKCIVKDNKVREGNDNLFLTNGTRANLNVTRGSDVHILYEGLTTDYQMITEGKENDQIKNTNCIQFLTSDNRGYHFTFNDALNQRKIYMVKDGLTPAGTGSPFKKQVNTQTIAAEAAAAQKTGQTFRVGGNTYAVLRGFFTHPDVDNDNRDAAAVFYYSDGLFAGDPVKYDEHLATASLSFAMSGFYLNAGGKADYTNKHAAARQFLADIGVAEKDIYVNDLNTLKPGTDTIGVTIGNKKLKDYRDKDTGYTLVAVTVRGAGYESEWASNVTLNDAGEAGGFGNAADQVFGEIERYLDNHGLRGELDAGRVKFWVVGYSRAGATANLTSKRLVDKYRNSAKIFGYCCEAPQGGKDSAQDQSLIASDYYCIHNMINAADLVPLVAPTGMLFKRYGVDHYIPGTKAGNVREVSRIRGGDSGSPETRTTYADNEIIMTKTDAYNTQRNEKMLKQLAAIDSEMIFDDYFHLATMDYVNTKFVETGPYEAANAEQFIQDFIKSLMHWGGIETRSQYSSKAQPIFRDLTAMVFGMSAEKSADFIARASSAMQRFSMVTPLSSTVSKFEVYRKVIKNWHTLSDEDKKFYRNAIYNKLLETGAFEFLTEDQARTFQSNWPQLAEILFSFVSHDYQTEGKATWENSYADADHPTVTVFDYNNVKKNSLAVGTMGYNASRLMSAHYPEINLAWARSYDSWYDNEATEYTIATPASLNAPTATADGTALVGQNSFKFNESKRFALDVPNVSGEAIYYTLNNKTNGTKSATNKIYKDSFTLSNQKGAEQTTYEISAYAMWHGAKSPTATWTITIGKTAHALSVKHNSTSGEAVTDTLSGNDREMVSLIAQVPNDKVFVAWSATDETGKDVTDVVFSGDYRSELHKPLARVALPTGGTNGLSENYSLEFQAIYKDKISNLTVALAQPTTGAALQTTATVSWGSGEDAVSITAPVSWRYLHGTMEDVHGSGTVEAGATYWATIRFTENEEAAFTSNLTAALAQESGTATSITARRSGGDVTIRIEFPQTEGTHTAQTTRTITLNCYDAAQNTPIKVETFEAKSGSEVTVFAPEIDDYEFSGWLNQGTWLDVTEVKDSNGTVIGLKFNMTDANQTFDLKYHPVVNSVHVTIDPAPEADEYLPTELDTTVKYKVQNEYTVASNCIGLEWEPAPLDDWWIADYDTAYTAFVWLQPDSDGKITVLDSQQQEHQIDIEDFVYADDLVVEVNGEAAAFDCEENMTWYRFPATEGYSTAITSVTQPTDITNVAYGASNKDIRALLPTSATVTVHDGNTEELPVAWTNLSQQLSPGDAEGLEESIWTATGSIAEPLPAGINNDNNVDLSVTQTIHVNSAPYTPKPQCTVPEGVQTSSFEALLFTALDGATIYYTKDGSDPADNGIAFDGSPITISRADAIEDSDQGEDDPDMAVIRAIATAPGHKQSAEVAFVYLFTDQIAPPAGEELTYSGEEQVGVWGNELYTLTPVEGDTLVIDDDGNAVATSAGTYKVTAKLTDPSALSWMLDDGSTIDNDQEIEFTIAQRSLAHAKVSVEPSALYTGKAITPQVSVTLDEETVQASDYTVEFSNNTAVGMATVTVKAVGNCKDDPTPATFAIVPQQAEIGSVASDVNKLTAKMSKDVGATGGTSYEIAYKKSASASWKTISTTASEQLIDGLEGGSSYTLKARVCATVGGAKVYGAWSDEVTATPKKEDPSKEEEDAPEKEQKGKDGTNFGKGASLATAEKGISEMRNDNDPAGTVFKTLRLRSTKQAQKSITLSWKKVKGAAKYVVFANKCGKKSKLTKVKTLKGNKFVLKKVAKSKLKKGTYYKCLVIAIDKNNKVLSTSKITHVATKGGKVGNYKAVKTAAKKNAVSLTAGKKFKLKGKCIKASKKVKVKVHRKIAYESSNTKVATVSKTGVIKGKKPGKCIVYAYAQSGLFKAVKVTVKSKGLATAATDTQSIAAGKTPLTLGVGKPA